MTTPQKASLNATSVEPTTEQLSALASRILACENVTTNFLNQTSLAPLLKRLHSALLGLSSDSPISEVMGRFATLTPPDQSTITLGVFVTLVASQAPAVEIVVPSTPLSPEQELLVEIKDSIKKNWELYAGGKFKEGLEATRKILEKIDSQTLGDAVDVSEPRGELLAISAWCHYRLHDYDAALTTASHAANHRQAQMVELYVRMYRPEHSDEARETFLLQVLEGTLVAANAVIIRGRDLEVPPYELVERYVSAWSEKIASQVEAPSEAFANLLHNAARVFMKEPTTTDYLNKALALLKRSLEVYEEVQAPPHHRAAANFWLSSVHETLGDLKQSCESLSKLEEAIAASEVSEECWLQQIGLETQNTVNLGKYIKAKNRTLSLKSKLEAAKARAA